MRKEKQYQLWLLNVAGIGAVSVRELLKVFQSAEDIYNASERELGKLLKPAQVKNILSSKGSWNVLEEYEKLLKQKIEFTCYGDRDYPERMRSVPNPPAVLYYQGRLPSDIKPSIAIIGARACSEYGSFLAKEFGSKLAMAGIQIISGLAMGIDGISQAAAVAAGGKSFGVLGCGVDICYPASNRFLYEKLRQQGGILSEYAPGTQPAAGLFPPRNRIISGLSDAVVVIEAREKSGTLITVDMALEQGREVFAVPGRVTDSLSSGCLKLLHQGAGLAVSPQDILESLYGIGMIKEDAGIYNIEEKEAAQADLLSEKEKQVLLHLTALSKTPEEIYAEFCGAFSIQEIMGILVELCVKGMAVQEPGNGYCQKNPCILKKYSV